LSQFASAGIRSTILFSVPFAEGKLTLKALGRYQALHYHFVSYAVRSFG
jgi:hypothetical protein